MGSPYVTCCCFPNFSLSMFLMSSVRRCSSLLIRKLCDDGNYYFLEMNDRSKRILGKLNCEIRSRVSEDLRNCVFRGAARKHRTCSLYSPLTFELLLTHLCYLEMTRGKVRRIKKKNHTSNSISNKVGARLVFTILPLWCY